MTTLRSCPFCGGEASITPDYGHSTAVYVGCPNTSCVCYSHWEETAAEAIAAWNRRATPPEVATLVEALREIFNRHIPDQPASFGGDEAEWATRQHTELRRIARAALAKWEAAD